MTPSRVTKARLVIAGPGAGKTHNMVNEIVQNLPNLSSCRFMAVITYTNAATNNIKERLSKKITVPPNLFIGTIHSFLNKFIVIPFSSFSDISIPQEKLFLQFGIDKAFDHIQKNSPKKAVTFEEVAKLRARIADSLKKKGYITFDQTLTLSRDSMTVPRIAYQVANRLQFLFVDEFQDSGNEIFSILEVIRKIGLTQIYCVGDPEQYIQSFDSSIRSFTNIPILKAAANSSYLVALNNNNFRCSQPIVDFLNHFNCREFNGVRFSQVVRDKSTDCPPKHLASAPAVFFFKTQGGSVSSAIERFSNVCDTENISMENRCLLAKEERLVKRIIAAVNNKYMNPKKTGSLSPVSIIRDTVLYVLSINSEEFYNVYKKTSHDLRKLAVELFHAIDRGDIMNENQFVNYLRDNHNLYPNRGMLIKVEDLRSSIALPGGSGAPTVANIHTIKGLEHKAVLVFAKNEEELAAWLETDRSKRDSDKNDVCRIGYVAFSRAERLLAISCLGSISTDTENILKSKGVKIIENET
jgi:DNA helicase-2/ATP-dependent DNA helicase PcrA